MKFSNIIMLTIIISTLQAKGQIKASRKSKLLPNVNSQTQTTLKGLVKQEFVIFFNAASKVKMPTSNEYRLSIQFDSTRNNIIYASYTLQHARATVISGFNNATYDSKDTSWRNNPDMQNEFRNLNKAIPFILTNGRLDNKLGSSDLQMHIEDDLGYLTIPLKASGNLREGFSWHDTDTSYATTTSSNMKIISVSPVEITIAGDWLINFNQTIKTDAGEQKQQASGPGHAVFKYNYRTGLLKSYSSEIKLNGTIEMGLQKFPMEVSMSSTAEMN